MDALEKFRMDTREWLEENCPESLRHPVASIGEHVWGGRKIEFKTEDQRLWFDRMKARGWFCPSWPQEYGGGELSAAEHQILKEEMKRINARPPQVNLGCWMTGPVILEFGTEEQKQEYLPKIANGEIRWCQGYSEPGAGSDLAGLQCKAVRDGDDFIINGSKIWTSYANLSDWIYCLVRTDPDVPKREGITFLLFDMESEGVSIKPIELVNGESHFCQIFFDNVRVPVKNVLGEINKGWTVAKRVLEFERAMMGEIEEAASRHEDSPVKLAKKHLPIVDGKIADTIIRDRIAKNVMNTRAFNITMQRVIDEFEAKDPMAGMAAVIAKYQGTEEDKRKYQIIMDILGTQGLGWEGPTFDEEELRLPRSFLATYSYTIAGGTSEIQLNIIANRVLGLPE